MWQLFHTIFDQHRPVGNVEIVLVKRLRVSYQQRNQLPAEFDNVTSSGEWAQPNCTNKNELVIHYCAGRPEHASKYAQPEFRLFTNNDNPRRVIYTNQYPQRVEYD